VTSQLARPDEFKIELFADFATFGRLKAFQLTLTKGEHGFPAGLYVTSGPTGDDRSDRLIYLNRDRKASVMGRESEYGRRSGPPSS
jgi:hypothetical protein